MSWTRPALVAIIALAACAIGYAAGGERERMEISERVAEMLADLPAAAEAMPPHSPAREAIEAGEVDRAREMLSFRPLAEAPVPEGFPSFTPVGLIEVKQYPAYRKASGPGFWQLFQHIQAEQIPMTAPVEMTRGRASKGDDAGGGPKVDGRSPMAFLYQNTGVGQTGEAGVVAVTDNEPTVAVSLGVRGKMTSAGVADATKRLQAWLAANPQYRAAGEESVRLFGYNSPMVPANQTYWEAQIVIEAVDAEPAPSDAAAAEQPTE
ncbi:MAG: heme-binding protein [Planctomycetota bacterium]